MTNAKNKRGKIGMDRETKNESEYGDRKIIDRKEIEEERKSRKNIGRVSYRGKKKKKRQNRNEREKENEGKYGNGKNVQIERKTK